MMRGIGPDALAGAMPGGGRLGPAWRRPASWPPRGCRGVPRPRCSAGQAGSTPTAPARPPAAAKGRGRARNKKKGGRVTPPKGR